MGSICTQTDFLESSAVFKNNNIQLFLCLVKNNDASTQCSLLTTQYEAGEFKPKKRNESIAIQVQDESPQRKISQNDLLEDASYEEVVKIEHEDILKTNGNQRITKYPNNYDSYFHLKDKNSIRNLNTQDFLCELEINCDQDDEEHLYLSRKITRLITDKEIAKLEIDICTIENSFLDDNSLNKNENYNGLKINNASLSQYKNSKRFKSFNDKRKITNNYKNKYKNLSTKKRRQRLVGPFECEKCDIKFDLYYPYFRHLSSHEKKEGKICNICNKVLSSEINLKRHLLTHTGKPFICEVCGRGFTGHYMLRDHLISQHKKTITVKELETYFKCLSCGKFLASSGALSYHQAREHTCKHCKVKWPCRDSLRDHIMAHHDNIKKDKNGQIICNFCDQTFLYRHGYISHMAKHNGVKNYECTICGKKFSMKTSLQIHIKQVHEKYNYLHACSYCPKKFICNAKLVEHERVHTGEKPFSCSFCNMSFAAKATYKRHVKLVHKETPNLKCINK